ncbi:hypothetical protein F2Q69_00016691 [Brassica cretica]|uniref:Uncharacterized protein n=1 Tax=Brassica cretica TaxID=69181 RepID=A0A8S9QVK4_BRACR|nr:hypothetical protein F2Q69_00016691 [Brassica cretica]
MCRRRSPFCFAEVVPLIPFFAILSTTALFELCSVVVGFMREVEAYSDPLSPSLASGKGSLLQFCLRRLLVTKSGGLQSSALPLRNLTMKLSGDGDDFQGKKSSGSRTVMGSLEACQLMSSDERGFRWCCSGGVEAVTTRDALMEQISPRVEPASSTRYPTGSCGF